MTPDSDYARPASRRIGIYSIDPSLSQKVEAFEISTAIIDVPWESDLQPGPIGEYVEVMDYCPSHNVFFKPVDLNHPHVMARHGLQPTEGDPRFHQQMVYAVAMKTISTFERALGRVVLWSDRSRTSVRPELDAAEAKWKVGRAAADPRYVQRLRIYPHALRTQNAYYDPSRKAVLFGYFPSLADFNSCDGLSGGLVFTALSFDIISHEMTHAILDGIHPRFIEATNRDVPAFHEAFADLVALFQHFSLPDLLEHQISHTGGEIAADSLLTQLAGQFGKGIGRNSALRDAFGEEGKDGKWQRKGAENYQTTAKSGAHVLGSFLVSAIFDAFTLVYKKRTADLVRLASEGTGMLRPGSLQPELVGRLADEAAKLSRHFLGMCIRALDYVPPVDITFGEYLRALLTADFEVAPEDPLGYRVALVESFRKWGILPPGVKSVSEDSLRWKPFLLQISTPGAVSSTAVQSGSEAGMKDVGHAWMTDFARRVATEVSRLNLSGSRMQVHEWSRKTRAKIHSVIQSYATDSAAADTKGRDQLKSELIEVPLELRQELLKQVFGIDFAIDPQLNKPLPFEVHSVRPSIKHPIDGSVRPILDVIIVITQTRRIEVAGETKNFRGGATIVLSLDKSTVKYVIHKSTNSADREARTREFWLKPNSEYFSVDEDQMFQRIHNEGDL